VKEHLFLDSHERARVEEQLKELAQVLAPRAVPARAREGVFERRRFERRVAVD